MIKRFFASHSETVAKKYRVVVIGGGSAGVAVAARLSRQHEDTLTTGMVTKNTDAGFDELKYDAAVGIVEPSKYHYYQPLWTLVGGGYKKFEDSRKLTSDVLKDLVELDSGTRVQHVDSKALVVKPEVNTVVLPNGDLVKYDYLVVAAGIECKWDSIPGLKEAIETPESKVTSNYHPEAVQRTSRMIANLQEGDAIFTQPSTPIKCAGAPQKIAYLAEEIWRNLNLRDRINVSFVSGAPKLFAVDKYAAALTDICIKRDINISLGHELVNIDNEKNLATFKLLSPDAHKGTEVTKSFDFMHVTPHMAPPAFIRESGLANTAGYCEVDTKTLQHVKFKNVFSLGDASSLPVSKTASAAAAQTGIVVENLAKQIEADTESEGAAPGSSAVSDFVEYSGYTACPLVTGKTSLILAEFNGFTFKPRETFWFDQKKESLFLSVVKSEVLPILYWDVMLKGNWYPEKFRGFFNPRGSD